MDVPTFDIVEKVPTSYESESDSKYWNSSSENKSSNNKGVKFDMIAKSCFISVINGAYLASAGQVSQISKQFVIIRKIIMDPDKSKSQIAVNA